MELQNDKKTIIAAQTEATIGHANLPTEPVEDMELNDEQLDIISGGGDGFIKVS
ncbi:hypothetical protein M0L20_29435 [Spirosoma sp. RP8]|uniref:Bacteriocin n=1 Tax=Spirosoma liriopis TaxID=2937440 RepID=A0ABT0HWW7_9BACT|nr:hypothetical protein [Spirosoma liriopis]MCK8496025.1 hypothetical protein [Spirosoma liriopis]